MNGIVRWWEGCSKGERIFIGIVGGTLIVATGGALAYALATGGVVVASGNTVILVGAATSLCRARSA